jgi:hypothetical protein
MSDERTAEFSEPRVGRGVPASPDGQNSDSVGGDAASGNAKRNEPATNDAPRHEAPAAPSESARVTEHGSPARQVSVTKLRLQSRLPALDDDADVGVPKEHIVTRDGKADLLFAGALLASAAPASPPKGRWQEYRIYRTNGEKHVFSKVTRSVLEGEDDTHEAEVFDPSPSSVPSQLLRSAREIARQRPMTWMDAAVAFFGYDPLAKALYRKLSVRFEEQIS